MGKKRSNVAVVLLDTVNDGGEVAGLACWVALPFRYLSSSRLRRRIIKKRRRTREKKWRVALCQKRLCESWRSQGLFPRF